MATDSYHTRDSFERKNEKFEAYYRTQNIVPEGQWDQFITSIKSDLPITFRLVSNTVHTEVLRAKTEEICRKFPDLCQPITWYPGGLAYQLNVTRAQLRSEPHLKEFHQMIVLQAEAGTMFRQEAVSMIPVALLDVQPEHAVIDMCAAPGSKTSQILERMHSLWDEKGRPDGLPYPPGVCVANDFSPKRAHMLIHHVTALNSPSLVVTTRSAQLTPNMFLEGSGERVQYDRVLADVPCSGDGTLRKAPSLWPRWTESAGCALHRLQLQIAKRGAHLLRVGGRMVYSTCSLNPLENEAVVHSLIKEAAGALRIVDASQELQGLNRLTGLLKWKATFAGEEYTSFETLPAKIKKRLQETAFPPASEEAALALGLDKCMRFLPHLSNTGGFFVTVIEKVSECPWETPLTERRRLKKQQQQQQDGEEEAADVAKKPKIVNDEDEDDEAEAADVAALAAEEANMAASGETAAVLAASEENKKVSKQEQLEQEDAKLEIFRKRTRCVDFEALSNVDDAISSRLWTSAAGPLGLGDLTNELASRLLVRTSAAEARHRQLEQRKELMKRERASRMGHKKGSGADKEEKKQEEEKQEESPAPVVAAAPEGDGRGVPEVPRRVWLTSQRASELIRSKGRAPYKVLHAGVPVWERNRAPVPQGGDSKEEDVWNTYRPSMACGKWIMGATIKGLVEATKMDASFNPTAEQATASVTAAGLAASVVLLPPTLFFKMLATSHTPPRIGKDRDLTEEEKPYFEALAKERCALMVTECSQGIIEAPLWVGRGNLEVLLDMTTKKSIEYALTH